MGCVEYLVRKQLAEVLSITTFAHLMLSDNYSRDFYPPDAMLARVLAMALCPCLCLSVTRQCSIKRDERINMLFGVEASFDQSYTAI